MCWVRASSPKACCTRELSAERTVTRAYWHKQSYPVCGKILKDFWHPWRKPLNILPHTGAFCLRQYARVTVSCRRRKNPKKVMFKIVNELSPHYLHESLEYCSTGYNLRNFDNTLFVPKPRTSYGKQNLNYNAAVLRNNLPRNVRAICSLSQLKRKIENVFFSENGLLHGNTAILKISIYRRLIFKV